MRLAGLAVYVFWDKLSVEKHLQHQLLGSFILGPNLLLLFCCTVTMLKHLAWGGGVLTWLIDIVLRTKLVSLQLWWCWLVLAKPGATELLCWMLAHPHQLPTEHCCCTVGSRGRSAGTGAWHPAAHGTRGMYHTTMWKATSGSISIESLSVLNYPFPLLSI